MIGDDIGGGINGDAHWPLQPALFWNWGFHEMILVL